jgi:predicted metalloenzyme YecM
MDYLEINLALTIIMDLNIRYNEINHVCIKLGQKASEQTPLISVVIDLNSVAIINLARITMT